MYIVHVEHHSTQKKDRKKEDIHVYTYMNTQAHQTLNSSAHNSLSGFNTLIFTQQYMYNV